jgi:uncharacterized membrane protein YoaK (UPF0700 family)
MTREPASPPARAGNVMLALLAMAAGCVDAVSYLGLGRVLTAAMTGNTLLLGIALGQAELAAALRAATALTGFVAGAVLGAAIVDRGGRAVWSPPVMLALALELAVLVLLALGWPRDVGDQELHLLIAAAGLAMGIQSAAAHRIGVPGVATTYVTGTLTSLSARLVRWLRAAGTPSDPAPAIHGAWLAVVWLVYGVGAVVAGAVELWWPKIAVTPALAPVAGQVPWPAVALLLPIVLIAGVIGGAALARRRRPRASGSAPGPRA